jgi:hypothetical protein
MHCVTALGLIDVGSDDVDAYVAVLFMLLNA